ncbi:MAG TPA: shikimate dehydrogenase [Blastocatellia bacterium]|jgi:3-dehydroquinate dehydratase/shikimate dehydrogenase|nr:shikimate dehydrogenase [Blastocatellia bacterium]
MAENKGKICAVITEESVQAAGEKMERAARVAGMIELRVDYLRDLDFANPEPLRPLIENKPLPVIITCRAGSEGGAQTIEDETRLRLLARALEMGADYCDVEAAHYDRFFRLSPDPERLIVSHHNFDSTPSNLEEIYESLCALPSAVQKVATKANGYEDAMAHLRLLDRASREGRRSIAVAMGEAGVITRLLGPARGAFLTYGSLAPGQESAPGQATCEEMKELYRVASLSPDTRVMGIIGKPVGHSASPAMHNAAFRAMDLDAVYLPLEVDDLEGFFTSVARGSDLRLRGLSVTIPHKRAVIPFLDRLDPVSRGVGAVNTVVFEGSRLTGYNTDVRGVLAPLEEVCDLEGVVCGVIGAGGAARAVVYGLKQRRAEVVLFARDVRSAEPVAREFDIPIERIQDAPRAEMGILINTTPVGMRGHSEGRSPVPSYTFSGREIAYDLVYNPEETRFLSDARQAGCRVIGGIEMLVAQAALQFELWTGARPPLEVLRSAATR